MAPGPSPLTPLSAVPQFDLQQAHIYCDTELARHEGCCEISVSGVSAAGRALLEGKQLRVAGDAS